MGRFIARRLVQAIPTLFGIMLLTFLLTRLSPSDPVQLMVAGNFDITVEDKANLRHSLGLDDPLPLQFVHWLGSAITLDLGNSFYYHRPVTQLIWERLPNTIQYTIPSLVLTGHVLRNALIPVVTIFGGLLTIVLSSSLVIEQVFNWPGLGRLLFEAAVNKDYPLVQATVIIGAVLLLLSYILRDIAYAIVDPRIKVR